MSIPNWLTDELIAEMTELQRLADAGIATVPSRKFVAEFVRMQRDILGWTKQMLGAFLGVSLSTVERIERGEDVSSESLERIATVLSQKPGAFTMNRSGFAGGSNS
jgi:DNA-binding XRE family transcriptional regulator